MSNDRRKLTAKMVTEALDMMRKKEYEHKGNVFLLTEQQHGALFGRLLAIEFQLGNPWVKTADRLPVAEEGVIGATGEPEVLAITKYAHGYYPDVKMVSKVREPMGWKYFPYWMPLPNLPVAEE